MRAILVGCAFETMDEPLAASKAGVEIGHDPSEGIKTSQAIAAIRYRHATSRLSARGIEIALENWWVARGSRLQPGNGHR